MPLRRSARRRLSSSRVAAWWCHLDVGWDLETCFILLRVSYFDYFGMYWPSLASYLGCKLNQLTFADFETSTELGNAVFTFPPLKLRLDDLTYASWDYYVLFCGWSDLPHASATIDRVSLSCVFWILTARTCGKSCRGPGTRYGVVTMVINDLSSRHW